jgi:phototropin
MFHLAPVHGLDGKVQYFLGVQVDVTARDDDDGVLGQSSVQVGKEVLGSLAASLQVLAHLSRFPRPPLRRH